MSRPDLVHELEFRPEKPYDERRPGTVICPGHIRCSSLDREFQVAATNAALELWRAK